MYVDPAETESMKTHEKDDVKEATEALKGLLGLSTSPSPAATAPETDHAPPPPLPQEDRDASKPKKNKRKKKKKNANNNANGESELRTTPPKPKGKNAGKGKQKNQKPKEQKDESENYAWSAFQSSPDASKLPIPAFTPPKAEKNVIDVPPAVVDSPISSLARTESGDKTPPIKTEDLEEAVKPPDQSPKAIPSIVTPGDLEQQRKFSSETGVNLAALAAEQRPTGGPPSFSNYPPAPPPQYYPPNMPPVPNPYAAPPGYITIQLQLPMVLPPDRTIVVQSPSGYPISVRVPEAFMPGTIIPVNVPTGPPMMYNYPPPH